METGWEPKRIKRMMTAMLSACFFGRLYILLRIPEPWNLLLLGIEVALGIVLISLLVHLVRGRREDYWREREQNNQG